MENNTINNNYDFISDIDQINYDNILNLFNCALYKHNANDESTSFFGMKIIKHLIEELFDNDKVKNEKDSLSIISALNNDMVIAASIMTHIANIAKSNLTEYDYNFVINSGVKYLAIPDWNIIARSIKEKGTGLRNFHRESIFEILSSFENPSSQKDVQKDEQEIISKLLDDSKSSTENSESLNDTNKDSSMSGCGGHSCESCWDEVCKCCHCGDSAPADDTTAPAEDTSYTQKFLSDKWNNINGLVVDIYKCNDHTLYLEKQCNNNQMNDAIFIDSAFMESAIDILAKITSAANRYNGMRKIDFINQLTDLIRSYAALFTYDERVDAFYLVNTIGRRQHELKFACAILENRFGKRKLDNALKKMDFDFIVDHYSPKAVCENLLISENKKLSKKIKRLKNKNKNLKKKLNAIYGK